MGEGYRTFDHTADLGLEVWAGTPERLFELAAVAVLAQVAEAGAGEPIEETARVATRGPDRADLLVDWLNQALLRAELARAVWTRARIERLDEHALEGWLGGPRLDPGRHVLLREVKAISHHDLALDLTPGACRCRMVLDL